MEPDPLILEKRIINWQTIKEIKSTYVENVYEHKLNKYIENIFDLEAWNNYYINNGHSEKITFIEFKIIQMKL